MSIEFLSRETILKQNQIFARHIHNAQLAFAPDLFEPGEEVLLDDESDEATALTVEMADKLNREANDQWLQGCDPFDPQPPQIEESGTLVAELPCRTFDLFAETIGGKVEALCHALSWDILLVLPVSVTPYLTQENDFPPVKRATTALVDLGLEPNFSGGMGLQPSSAARVFGHLFWIVRCNASAPNVAFAAAGSSVVGTLCDYGNIHFDTYRATEKAQLAGALRDVGFNITRDGACEEKFSDESAVEGRKLVL